LLSEKIGNITMQGSCTIKLFMVIINAL
jgi:hypothetical protein